MSILVIGGAGYIGSHVAKELINNGSNIVILDNMSTGHKEAIDAIKALSGFNEDSNKLKVYYGDIRDRKLLSQILCDEQVSAIVHLAAFSQVGESMQNPGKYFDNNVSGTISLLESMVRADVKHIVFSSTAAVYGEPCTLPIDEMHPTLPTNVYGASKLMVEELLHWYDHVYGIKHIALRYFNTAGADAGGLIGEHHEPETHLVPLVLQTIMGKRDSLMVYGDDYPTPDGTCIRDYIHVSDLAQAHILALEALKNGGDSKKYNLGNGNGYSVKSIVDAAYNVTGLKVPYQITARRAGDPAVLVADATRIKEELGWQVQYTELESIMASAWLWHRKHPSGYYAS